MPGGATHAPFNCRESPVAREDLGKLLPPELLRPEAQCCSHVVRSRYQVRLGQCGGGVHQRVKSPMYLHKVGRSAVVKAVQRACNSSSSYYLTSAGLTGAVSWECIHVLMLPSQILQQPCCSASVPA